MNPWLILAEAIRYLHGIVAILLILGPLLLVFAANRNGVFKWYLRLYVPLALCTIPCQIVFDGCPLTKIENSLRSHVDANHAPMESFVTTIGQQYLAIHVPPEAVTAAALALWFSALVVVCTFITKRLKIL